MSLKAPFPYPGGKSRVAASVWERLGNIPNYVEPFCGSCAMLLSRPNSPQRETVNDVDGMIANFWRAVKHNPDAVVEHADNPVFENDLHARHVWLVGRKESLQSRLEGDPEFYDAKVAGWWCWGMCCWIIAGWCSGKGGWWVEGGKFIRKSNNELLGVKRQRFHIKDRGIRTKHVDIVGWMQALSDRLHYVRVCCGDWSRVANVKLHTSMGLTGVFLDPPYSDMAERAEGLYSKDDMQVAHTVREWCLENGDNKLVRIAFCGYDGEHKMPRTWDCVGWRSHGGGGTKSKNDPNIARERIWFSPHCLVKKNSGFFY